MSIALKLLSLIGLLLVAGSYGGAVHPIGDSLAVARLPLVVATALCLIWTDWPRRLRWPLALGALAVIGQVVLAKAIAPAPGPLTIYQKNLWSGNANPLAVAADIRALVPDVVTLQEVSDSKEKILDDLRANYPAQQRCDLWPGRTVAVVSRLPAIPGSGFCARPHGFAALQVEAPDGPVWVLSFHTFWPWPMAQKKQVDGFMDQLEALSGPVVIGGDFNMVPWGHSVRRIARATRTKRAGPVLPTYALKHFETPLVLPFPIDHVFAPGGGRVERRPLLGSDHYGLWGQVHVRGD